MTAERKLLIGSSFGTGEEAVAFLSNRNFDESNVIVWTPSTVSTELEARGKPYPPKTAADALERRLVHLSQWVAQGHTLILVRHVPLPYKYKSGANVISSALEKHAPLDGVAFTIAAGTRVEYCGPSAVAALFQNHVAALKYDVVLEGGDLVPLLRVARGSPGSTQVVGAYRKYGQGLIVYLPPVSGGGAEWASYINDALKIPRALKSSRSELPDWIDQYLSAADEKAIALITQLSRQVNDLQCQLEAQRALIETSRDLKRLIFDTGMAFADAVAAALTELGLTIVEGPHPRADLLASNGVQYAAIEAKGIEGPAKERDVRQTIQWMAEVDNAIASSEEELDADLHRYAEQLAKLPINSEGKDCKGLLVLGTYRKQSLAERTQPDFPEPVKRVLERSDVCALTGLQLLGLVLQVRQDPSMKPIIITELFATKGVLQRAQQWNEFLSLKKDD